MDVPWLCCCWLLKIQFSNDSFSSSLAFPCDQCHCVSDCAVHSGISSNVCPSSAYRLYSLCALCIVFPSQALIKTALSEAAAASLACKLWLDSSLDCLYVCRWCPVRGCLLFPICAIWISAGQLNHFTIGHLLLVTHTHTLVLLVLLPLML